MANVPVDYISLAEAFTRFREAFDTEEAITAPAPERADAYSDDEHEEAQRQHGSERERVWCEAVASFRAELALEYFVALYEKEGKPRLYKVEAQEWIDADTRLIRHFYVEPHTIQEMLGDKYDSPNLTLFVHELTFDKWMQSRFAKPTTDPAGVVAQSEKQSKFDYERMCQSRECMHGTLRAKHLPLNSSAGICWQGSDPKKWLQQDHFVEVNGSVLEGMKSQMSEAVRAGLEPPLKSGQLCEYLRVNNEEGSVAWCLSYTNSRSERCCCCV